MKLFVTGISGLLGLNFALQARERLEVSGSYYAHPIALPGVESIKLDLTSGQSDDGVFPTIRPDVIVHTAGLTNVEGCEADPAQAFQLNVGAAERVARIAKASGARLVHISTDHLFDGRRPWRTETDTPTPMNNYARTKCQAEQVVMETCPDALIIRCNFFGWGTRVRTSFSDWILRSLEQRQELRMFDDVFFTPMLINDLIDVIIELVARGSAGIFNVVGGERLTKYAFALKAAEMFGHSAERIRATSIDEVVFKARRPKDMSLSSLKLEEHLLIRVPGVADGLRRLRRLRESGWSRTLDQSLQGGD